MEWELISKHPNTSCRPSTTIPSAAQVSRSIRIASASRRLDTTRASSKAPRYRVPLNWLIITAKSGPKTEKKNPTIPRLRETTTATKSIWSRQTKRYSSQSQGHRCCISKIRTSLWRFLMAAPFCILITRGTFRLTSNTLRTKTQATKCTNLMPMWCFSLRASIQVQPNLQTAEGVCLEKKSFVKRWLIMKKFRRYTSMDLINKRLNPRIKLTYVNSLAPRQGQLQAAPNLNRTTQDLIRIHTTKKLRSNLSKTCWNKTQLQELKSIARKHWHPGTMIKAFRLTRLRQSIIKR